jgi:hypothetical protein
MKKHGFYWHELRDFIFTQDDEEIAVSFTAYEHPRRFKFITHFLNHKFKRTGAKGKLTMRLVSSGYDEQISVIRRTLGGYSLTVGQISPVYRAGKYTEEFRCLCLSDVLARVIQHISNANYIAKKIPYKILKRIILLSEKEVFMEKNELDTV